MECRDLHNKLFDYLNDDVSDNERQEIKKHLSECEKCQHLAEKTKRSWKELKEDKIEYQPFFYTRLKHKMENRNLQRKYSSQLVRTLLQPALYFVILGIGIFIGIQLGSGIEKSYDQTVQFQGEDYIESVTEYQYINISQIDTIEQRLLNAENMKDYE